MIRLAVFDCDGTLVDSQANICTAMELAFAEVALPAPPRAAIRRAVGLSLAEVMRALHPDGDDAAQARLVAAYRAAFAGLRGTAAMADEPLFPDMRETLAAFADDGWTLGVATGKSDRGLAHILARHGIGALFATLQTADRHPSKPHPAMLTAAMAEAGATPDATVMIGDTSYDMAMARAGGTAALGVGWGYHGAEDLREAGAQAVAETVTALPRLAAGLVARR